MILQVTSDIDDEMPAPTGSACDRLEVMAAGPATGTFTLPGPGSLEVESHQLEMTP